MSFDENFLDFIKCLNKNEAEYVLVGGLAVIINGHSRTTGDMDIFIRRSEENCKKVLKAIDDFGFGSIGFTIEHLMDKDAVVQMGRVPFRIDILSDLPAVDFETVYNAAFIYEDDGVPLKVIHINHLIENKLAVGRSKDKMDAKALKQIKKRKKI